jgi:L-lactate dehydrogenase complex protein LldF
MTAVRIGRLTPLRSPAPLWHGPETGLLGAGTRPARLVISGLRPIRRAVPHARRRQAALPSGSPAQEAGRLPGPAQGGRGPGQTRRLGQAPRLPGGRDAEGDGATPGVPGRRVPRRPGVHRPGRRGGRVHVQGAADGRSGRQVRGRRPGPVPARRRAGPVPGRRRGQGPDRPARPAVQEPQEVGRRSGPRVRGQLPVRLVRGHQPAGDPALPQGARPVHLRAVPHLGPGHRRRGLPPVRVPARGRASPRRTARPTWTSCSRRPARAARS